MRYTEITAQMGTISGSTILFVGVDHVLAINPSPVELTVSVPTQMTATFDFFTNVTSHASTSWWSTNSATLQITQQGVATGYVTGTAEIWASYNGTSGSSVATVVVSNFPIIVEVGTTDAGGVTAGGIIAYTTDIGYVQGSNLVSGTTVQTLTLFTFDSGTMVPVTFSTMTPTPPYNSALSWSFSEAYAAHPEIWGPYWLNPGPLYVEVNGVSGTYDSKGAPSPAPLIANLNGATDPSTVSISITSSLLINGSNLSNPFRVTIIGATTTGTVTPVQMSPAASTITIAANRIHANMGYPSLPTETYHVSVASPGGLTETPSTLNFRIV